LNLDTYPVAGIWILLEFSPVIVLLKKPIWNLLETLEKEF